MEQTQSQYGTALPSNTEKELIQSWRWEWISTNQVSNSRVPKSTQLAQHQMSLFPCLTKMTQREGWLSRTNKRFFPPSLCSCFCFYCPQERRKSKYYLKQFPLLRGHMHELYVPKILAFPKETFLTSSLQLFIATFQNKQLDNFPSTQSWIERLWDISGHR